MNSNLPSTRREQFKEILRYRFLDIILVSLTISLFLIPNILFNIFLLDNDIFSSEYLINVVIIYLLKIPLFIIFGYGISGGMYFIKRLTFGLGASVRKDFFVGIRQNYKQFTIIYAFLGLIYFFIKVNSSILNYYNKDSIFNIVLIGIFYVFYILVIIVSFFMQTQAVLYNASLKQLLSNSIKFTIAKILPNLGIFLLIMFPFIIIELLSNYIILYISLCFYGLFYFGISLLILNMYTNNIYDKTINQNYKEMIRKGLKND